MSLAGIAIAIGAMVDASIVIVEQTHKKLERWGRRPAWTFKDVVIGAAKEVGGPRFLFAARDRCLFYPHLHSRSAGGRLFKPLAFTKNLAMLTAAVLSITLVPALIMLFIRVKRFEFRPRWLCRLANAIFVGKIHKEMDHPVSRMLMNLYRPVAQPCCGISGPRLSPPFWSWHSPSLSSSGSAQSSCRLLMKAPCFICRLRCRVSR